MVAKQMISRENLNSLDFLVATEKKTEIPA